MKAIDVSPEDLEQVLAILDRHLPGREVRAFGSRVAGKAKVYSDLDLAVMGEEPLSASVMADVREAFRESDLPFKVDVVDWATTSDTFRRIIEREFVVVRAKHGFPPEGIGPGCRCRRSDGSTSCSPAAGMLRWHHEYAP